jgi:uncharacterized protein
VLTVTADTNIYISALNFGGPPLDFLNMARAGGLRLDLSDPIMQEILRVLWDKFQWPPEDLQDAEQRISRFTTRVHPSEKLDIIKEDEPDNRILECAMAANSDFIVSGDNDLLRLGECNGVRILKVSDFLSLARNPEGPGQPTQ